MIFDEDARDEHKRPIGGRISFQLSTETLLLFRFGVSHKFIK